MSERAEAVLSEALLLSDDERAAVADGLWASLSEYARDELVADHGPTADPAFRAELQRRLDSVREHPEQLIDGDEAMRQIRARMAEPEAECQMGDRTKALFDQIMALPPDERYDLLDAVEEGEESYAADDPPPGRYTEEEWDAELARRLQSVEDGTAELLDGEQVFRELNEKLRRMRGE